MIIAHALRPMPPSFPDFMIVGIRTIVDADMRPSGDAWTMEDTINAVLDRMQSIGPATAPQLAASLGYSRPTVQHACSVLVERKKARSTSRRLPSGQTGLFFESL